MTIDREKLEKDQVRLWDIFVLESDDSDLTNEIRDLLFGIKSAYSDLIESEQQADDSYAFLAFCLRYINQDQDKTYINLEYDIGNVWRKVVERDDFPALLEEDLLTAIEEQKLGNVFQVQQIANDFTASENYPKARTYFELIKDHINNPTAWDNWARCCAAEGDFKSAVEVLINGMNDYPDSALLACNRAYYLYKNKKHSQSLDELQVFIDRAEAEKYSGDQLYIYAIKLKASIYRELSMPLQALIEYSRLTTAGNCDQAFAMESGELMKPHVEALTYG